MSRYETLSTTLLRHERLRAACACGHLAEFSQAKAIRLFGPDATPYDIRRRLRCSRCHQVGKVEVTINTAPSPLRRALNNAPTVHRACVSVHR